MAVLIEAGLTNVDGAPVLNGITFEFAYAQRQGGVWNFASETLSVLMVP